MLLPFALGILCLAQDPAEVLAEVGKALDAASPLSAAGPTSRTLVSSEPVAARAKVTLASVNALRLSISRAAVMVQGIVIKDPTQHRSMPAQRVIQRIRR